MAKKTAAKAATPSPSFEDAIAELEKITRDLENGGLSLDDSIKAYERGVELKKICQTKLDEAEKKLEVLERKEDGSFQKTPVDQSETQTGSLDQNRLFQN